MLHTVQLVYPGTASIFGVNVGQLGYLTAIEPAELDAALPAPARRRLRRLRTHDARSAGRDARAGARHALRAERGRAREAARRPPHSPRRVDQRQSVHGVRGRRRDRRDADGEHRVLVLGAGPDRVARAAVPAAHADLAAHAVRPFARARRARGARRSSCDGAHGRPDHRRARARRAGGRRPRDVPGRAGAVAARRAARRATSTRS